MIRLDGVTKRYPDGSVAAWTRDEAGPAMRLGPP